MRTSKGGIAAEPAGRSVWLQRAAQCAVQCGVAMHAAQVVVPERNVSAKSTPTGGCYQNEPCMHTFLSNVHEFLHISAKA